MRTGSESRAERACPDPTPRIRTGSGTGDEIDTRAWGRGRRTLRKARESHMTVLHIMERFGEFFDDIIKLVEGAKRQYGVANLQYTEFILERLEFCIISCNAILDQLRQHSTGLVWMNTVCT